MNWANTKGAPSAVMATSVTKYATHLKTAGTFIVAGSPGTFWARYESYAMVRVPTFHLAPPPPEEVRKILWQGRAATVSYLCEPDQRHKANACLYICNNHAYGLDTLPSAMRRNVRRGQKELRLSLLTPEELLAFGAQAYCDTRQRQHLSDGNPAEFVRYFGPRTRCREHVFLGAWYGKELAAFLSLTEVDDWREIEGCFSRDSLLHLRPNDVLMYTALSRYLVEQKCRLVSYGASSIQPAGNIKGLHAFKTKVGFVPYLVHRAFVVHPFLRPLANRFTLWAMGRALQYRPTDRRLLKAVGILSLLLPNQSNDGFSESGEILSHQVSVSSQHSH